MRAHRSGKSETLGDVADPGEGLKTVCVRAKAPLGSKDLDTRHGAMVGMGLSTPHSAFTPKSSYCIIQQFGDDSTPSGPFSTAMTSHACNFFSSLRHGNVTNPRMVH